MTPDQFAAIQRLREAEAKATPGPWQEAGRDVDHDRMVAEGRNPADACGLGCYVEGPPEAWLRGQFHRHADADFIAAAREGVPALLAYVDELREALGRTAHLLEDEHGRIHDGRSGEVTWYRCSRAHDGLAAARALLDEAPL